MILPLLAMSLQPAQVVAPASSRDSEAIAAMPGHDDTVVILACFAYEVAVAQPPGAAAR
jgi:hypothetical protein